MKVDIDLFSGLSVLVPTIVGAIFYLRLIRFAQILYWFVFSTFILEVAVRVLYELEINNMFLFHLYSFVEVTFICLIYSELLALPRYRKLIWTGFTIFQTFSIINLLFFDEITQFNSVQRYFEMSIIYSLIGFFAIQAMKQRFRYPIMKDPAFLLTIGLMVYYLGTFFLFVYGTEVLDDKDNSEWVIHGIFNIFLNLMYLIVFLRSRIQLSY